MGSPLIVPFNYQPQLTQVYDAGASAFYSSYTVPAGKYAYVQDTFGGLLINSLNTGAVISFSLSTAIGTQTAGHGAFSGANCRAQCSYSGSGGSSYSRVYVGAMVGAITSGTGGDAITSISLVANRTGGGSAVYASIPSPHYLRMEVNRVTNGTASANIYIYPTANLFRGWVKAGDLIEGHHFVVTEYNIIS